MLKPDFLSAKFRAALTYDDYLLTGTPQQQEDWTRLYNQASLTEEQRRLVGTFARDMKVLVSSGIWCGDCVQQCPLIQRIAEGSERIELRFVDRDEHADLAEHLKICGGMRVPVALFMAEDFELVSIFGDRTLSRYRSLAARQLGGACPMPGAPVPDEEVAATLGDWLDEFERVHLLLRLSTRLRQKHGD